MRKRHPPRPPTEQQATAPASARLAYAALYYARCRRYGLCYAMPHCACCCFATPFAMLAILYLPYFAFFHCFCHIYHAMRPTISVIPIPPCHCLLRQRPPRHEKMPRCQRLYMLKIRFACTLIMLICRYATRGCQIRHHGVMLPD